MLLRSCDLVRAHRHVAKAFTSPSFVPLFRPRTCNTVSRRLVAPGCTSSERAESVADEPTLTGSDDEELSGDSRKKRTVAMHVGYLGTNFRGSQLIREMPPEESVEGTLELALLKAGIIADSNYGDLYKIKWSRTSRTDKGVHALSSVFSFRALVDEKLCEADPEGISYAAVINEHLPEYVRVFSVQRVSKKYNCRRWCVRRTYEYYLPAFCLGLSEDTPAEEAARVVALFKDSLSQYVGRKPFHNYTARRAQYRDPSRGKKGKKAPAVMEDDDVEEEEQQGQQQAAALQAEAAAAQDAAQQAAAEASSPDDDASTASTEGASQQDEAGSSTPRSWPQVIRYLPEPDPNDKVVTSHYRGILSFECDDPIPLVPGGIPCLRLQVTGESFMLHHIRHMIGGAAAVARGIMPAELLPASLTAPVRVTIPRAPPHSLLLGDAFFSDFRKIEGEEQLAIKLTGPSLRLREQGTAAREAFRTAVMYPAVNELLAHPDWQFWSDNLPRYYYDAELAEQCVQQLTAWQAEQAARRAAKAAEAAAAEAEAAEAEAAEQAAQAAGEGQGQGTGL